MCKEFAEINKVNRPGRSDCLTSLLNFFFWHYIDVNALLRCSLNHVSLLNDIFLQLLGRLRILHISDLRNDLRGLLMSHEINAGEIFTILRVSPCYNAFAVYECRYPFKLLIARVLGTLFEIHGLSNSGRCIWIRNDFSRFFFS